MVAFFMSALRAPGAEACGEQKREKGEERRGGGERGAGQREVVRALSPQLARALLGCTPQQRAGPRVLSCMRTLIRTLEVDSMASRALAPSSAKTPVCVREIERGGRGGEGVDGGGGTQTRGALERALPPACSLRQLTAGALSPSLSPCSRTNSAGGQAQGRDGHGGQLHGGRGRELGGRKKTRGCDEKKKARGS